ncbi:MAG: hypothetical protein KC418_12220 [Anaerolineales bacterium]|nr:hypothetical protein [Anaerolineales bacterium]
MSGMDETTDFDPLWDYDHPAQTETLFRERLAEAAPHTSYTAQLLTQIARTQGLQRQFAAAHETLDTAEAMLQPDWPRARVRYLLERGRVYNSARHPEEARPLFLTAWEEASAAGEDFYAIDAAHMMGIIEPPAAQMAWNLQAVALAEQTNDARARNWLGSLYNNMGWSWHDQEDYVQALAYFEKALAWRKQQGGRAQIRIARWCVARALRSLGEVETALAMQRELMAEYEAAGEPGMYVLEEIAECLHALQRNPEEARRTFALAYAQLSQDPWLVANEPERLARLRQLGGVV